MSTRRARPPRWTRRRSGERALDRSGRFLLLTRCGGCGIRTREGLHPTRFPNPQTEVQRSPHVIVYACETVSRTLADADKRAQLRPKLRPHSPSGSTLNTADKMMCIVSLNPGSISRELIAQTVCVGNPTMPIAIRRPQTHETLSGKRRGEHRLRRQAKARCEPR
jgi:hypothetical protein